MLHSSFMLQAPGRWSPGLNRFGSRGARIVIRSWWNLSKYLPGQLMTQLERLDN